MQYFSEDNGSSLDCSIHWVCLMIPALAIGHQLSAVCISLYRRVGTIRNRTSST